MKAHWEVRSWREISSGYRFSLVIGAASCFAIFIINIGVTIWAEGLTDHDQDDGGRRVLYEGDCEKSRNLNTALHVLINVLSSGLLAASNYGIQCLSAPTRRQVDESHAEGEYLDIGIVSVRNLRRQGYLSRALWFTLVLSSVPLHLLYNSVVFSSLTVAREYSIILGDLRLEQSTDEFLSAYDGDEAPPRIKSLVEASGRSGLLDNLTVSDCIDQYAVNYLTSREDLILVQSVPEHDGPWSHRAISYSTGEAFGWICLGLTGNELCQPLLDDIRTNVSGWQPFDAPVRYCLSRPMEPQLCRVNFNVWLALGVISCNLIKMGVLAYIALFLAPDRLLVLGDAIQSFISHPDPCSTESSLTSARHVRDSYHGDKGPWQGPRRLILIRKRWISTLKAGRRAPLGLYFYTVAAVTVLALFLWATLSMALDFNTLLSLGFGEPNNLTTLRIVGDSRGIAASAALANLPHLILSFLYFHWNALFTSMAMGNEWNDLSLRRAALRVSDNPHGEQRSRYFLQLPYRFSIPLLAVSMLLHWILSQCVFVVAIETVELGSTPPDFAWGSVACGYSPVAVMTILAVSLVIPVSIFVFGWRRFAGPMPVVGSCSLAIAAACHHPDGKGHPDVALSALKWGVMVDWNRKQSGQGEGEEEEQETRGLLPLNDGYGHCGFSDEFVDEPQEGQVYA